MDDLMAGGSPQERRENPNLVAEREIPIKEEPAEQKENPMTAYFKLIAIMMLVTIGVPGLGFIILFPIALPFLARMPFLFALLPFAFIAYFVVVLYWFFKKGMYKKMIHASVRFGPQWSKQIMKDVPKDIKQVQNEQMNEFKKQLKEEIREELRSEMKREQQGYGGQYEKKPKENY